MVYRFSLISILLHVYVMTLDKRTQQAHNIETTSIQRQDVESMLNQRCFNVMCPLGFKCKILVTMLLSARPLPLLNIIEPAHTKPTIRRVRPVKIQNSLRICAVRSVFADRM